MQAWPADRPFAFGVTDCCSFCNFVVEQATGYRFLPAYNGALEADLILGRFGGLSNAVTHYLGQEPVSPDNLRPGDICFVEILNNEAIGILMESGKVAVIFEGSGLRALPFDFTDHGWRIKWA